MTDQVFVFRWRSDKRRDEKSDQFEREGEGEGLGYLKTAYFVLYFSNDNFTNSVGHILTWIGSPWVDMQNRNGFL